MERFGKVGITSQALISLLISMEYRYNSHHPITRFRLNKRVRYDWLRSTGSRQGGKSLNRTNSSRIKRKQ